MSNPTIIANGIVFDFGAGTLTIATPMSNQGFDWGALGNYVFAGFDDTITNVALTSEQNFGSGKADFINDFSFTAHSLTFSLQGGSSQNKNSALVFNITTAPAQVTSVPEPTTVALLGLALMGVATSRGKLAKKNA